MKSNESNVRMCLHTSRLALFPRFLGAKKQTSTDSSRHPTWQFPRHCHSWMRHRPRRGARTSSHQHIEMWDMNKKLCYYVFFEISINSLKFLSEYDATSGWSEADFIRFRADLDYHQVVDTSKVLWNSNLTTPFCRASLFWFVNLSEKILVNWDDYSQYMEKQKLFQTTNQFLLLRLNLCIFSELL